MKKLIYIIFALIAFSGCITNDIPYPVIVPNVVSVEVEGAEKVDVDNALRVITAHMEEYVDMKHITVKSIELDTEIAELSSGVIGEHDLSNPYKFSIRTYDDYAWTLAAEKHIERYFTVEGQIGSSVIDECNRRAIAVVGKNKNVANIKVTSLKLGPEGLSDYSMDMAQMKDFSHGITVDVTAFGQTETWKLFVEVTEENVEIKKINPWTREAYVTAAGIAENDNGFKYKASASSEWITVDKSDIEFAGGIFTAHITGLEPETDYDVIA